MAKKKVDYDLVESVVEVAAYTKGQILSGAVTKDNVHAMNEATKLAKELSSEEDDISRRKREAEARRAEAEARKAEAEAMSSEIDLANKPKKERQEFILETAKTAEPYITTAVTTGVAVYSLNKKFNFVDRMIKLETAIQHAGYYPMVKTSKALEAIISGILRG